MYNNNELKNLSVMRFKIRLDSDSRRLYITYKSERHFGYKIGELPRAFNKRESSYINLLGLTFTTANHKTA
jgi:hypothetical protein